MKTATMREKAVPALFPLFPMFWNVVETTGILAVLFFVHYGSSFLYTTYCVRKTWVGMLVSIFTVSSPFCKCLLEIQ